MRRMKEQKEEEGQDWPGQSEPGLCYRDGGITVWQEGNRAQKTILGERLKTQISFLLSLTAAGDIPCHVSRAHFFNS